MVKVFEIILKHNKVWFGLIFIGSVLNAIVQKINILNGAPYLTAICFFAGFVVGVIAHIRGKWLWV